MVLRSNGHDKPWYRENFRAPSDPQQREALWGPVLGAWMTPEDAQCKELESGAKLCDNPDGTTYVRVVKDRVMWMEYPDGSKSWVMHPHKVFRP